MGKHYTKLVMEARDAEQLQWFNHYITERDFATSLIIDEGRTEIEAFSPTALGVEIVDKDDPHTAATFGGFKTYRENKPKSRSQLQIFADWMASY